MLTLALDVDGVLLDADRAGKGHWTNELAAQLGIDRAQIQEAFFERSWKDVVEGRRPVEDGLAEALTRIRTQIGTRTGTRLGSSVDVESVLSCWFAADFVPLEDTFDLARRAAHAGCRVVLATNQEHRRAAYLTERIGAVVPLEGVFYSADIGCLKNDARFFEVVSNRLGLDADQGHRVVFVDDHMHNVEVARSIGWRGVHASQGEPWRAAVEELLGLAS